MGSSCTGCSGSERRLVLTKGGVEYDGSDGNGGWIRRPVVGGAALIALVDVLGEPAEALAVTLPLQHAAHEHLQWSRVQILQGNVALGEEIQETSLNICLFVFKHTFVQEIKKMRLKMTFLSMSLLKSL